MSLKKILVPCGLVLSLALLGGCTVAKVSGRGAAPLLLNQPAAKVEVVQDVQHSKMVTFDYTNAFDVSEVLRETLIQSDADAVINLVVTVKHDIGTFFINLFTLGLANATRFEVTGQAVKLPEGMALLDQPGIESLASSTDLDELIGMIHDRAFANPGELMLVRVGQGEDKVYHVLQRVLPGMGAEG